METPQEIDLSADPVRLETFDDPIQALNALSPERRHPAAAARSTDEEAHAGAALRLARRIVDLISDKMGSDILLLDIRGVSPIADYFVVCTAGSERQTSAILKDVTEQIQQEFGEKPLHVDGPSNSGWLLLDYGDVIVHVFSAEQRAYYKLEELWSAATPVLRLQ
jgi:ribosome-associated protein